jgi:SAM-dependent methyltransferase
VRSPELTPLAAALLHVPPPERALVVNSGNGEAALLVAREFPGARVRGVDPRPEQVREASARIGLDPEGRVAFKVGRPAALPYPDDFFGLAIQVDARPVPAEISRVLQPGGRFVAVRSRPPSLLPSLREARLGRRLARRGLVVERDRRAGDGNFLVARFEAHRQRSMPD